MSSSLTARLKMAKPDPGTSEPVNVTQHVNASLDKMDSAVGATLCTSSTRPDPPFPGQIIIETDTKRVFVYHALSTAWLQIPTELVEFAISRVNATDLAESSKVIGEANPRYTRTAAGVMKWGPGSVATDTTLARIGTGALQLTGSLDVTGAVTGSGAVYKIAFSGTTDASGFLTITHGASFTPTAGWWINTTPASSFAQPWGIDNFTSTQCRIRVANAAGTGALASGSVTGTLFLMK